jgi:predicted DNA-binding protein
MKKNTKTKTLNCRLEFDTYENLELMSKSTNTSKSKLVRMILNDWFKDKEELLNQYYEKTKTD